MKNIAYRGILLSAILAAMSASAGSAVATPLVLLNGWVGAPFGTVQPQVVKIGAAVFFKGAMSTTGTNPVAFQLPVGFRPGHNLWLTTNTCSDNPGRLDIRPDGTTTVESPNGFNQAQCFTNLDGVSFVP